MKQFIEKLTNFAKSLLRTPPCRAKASERRRNFALAIALGLALLAPAFAPAQVVPGSTVTLTNIPATMAANTSSNSLNSIIPIQQNAGMSLQWIFNTTSGGTANQSTLYIFPSVDGVNISQTNSEAWAVVAGATGTTNRVATTNWPAATLAGYQALILSSITNGTAGTLTNKSLIVNRWNPPKY